jgi:nucleotidyltransferase-like protein
MTESLSLRTISRALAGLLCGTEFGFWLRKRDSLARREIAELHRGLPGGQAEIEVKLGVSRWNPPRFATELADRLRAKLSAAGIIDLIVFGSQARGAMTRFSDLDAILLIEDAAAEDPGVLGELRAPILAAQRSVLRFQPMQHHGFELATPKLLRHAGESLHLPAISLRDSRSLFGTGSTPAFLAAPDAETSAATAREIASSLVRLEGWPSHPWRLHRTVSMFELLPALYLQSRGTAVAKSRSFDIARAHFGDAWWPYDVLREVRGTWPLVRAPALDASAMMVRNPWVAVAIWRRLPVSTPEPARSLLTDECLHALKGLSRAMTSAA